MHILGLSDLDFKITLNNMLKKLDEEQGISAEKWKLEILELKSIITAD